MGVIGFQACALPIYRGGMPAVPLEGGDAAVGGDELLRRRVELPLRPPRTDVLADQLEGPRDDRARLGHLLDLALRLADDHVSRTAACSSACWISAKTSLIVRSPWIGTTTPCAR